MIEDFFTFFYDSAFANCHIIILLLYIGKELVAMLRSGVLGTVFGFFSSYGHVCVDLMT